MEVNRLAVVHLSPALVVKGATASPAKMVTRLPLVARLVAAWKEASVTKALLITRVTNKRLAQADQLSVFAAAAAFHPFTPPPSPLLHSWEAVALSPDSIKDSSETVILLLFISFSSLLNFVSYFNFKYKKQIQDFVRKMCNFFCLQLLFSVSQKQI